MHSLPSTLPRIQSELNARAKRLSFASRGLFVRNFASQPNQDAPPKSDTANTPKPPNSTPTPASQGRLLYSAPQRLKFFGIGLFGAVQTVSAVLYAIILGFQPDYTMFEARSFVVVLLSAVTISYWVLSSAYRSHIVAEIIALKDGKYRLFYHGYFGGLSLVHDVPADQLVPLVLNPSENEKNTYYMFKVPGMHGIQMLPKENARFAELNQWGTLQPMFSGVNPAKKHKPIKPDPVPAASSKPDAKSTANSETNGSSTATPPPPPPPPPRQPPANSNMPPSGAPGDREGMRKSNPMHAMNAQLGKKGKNQQQRP